MREIAELVARVAELERRVAQTVQYGTIPQSNGIRRKDGQTEVRLILGQNGEGKDYLSDWIPWAQHAGALKIHTPPSPGMQVRSIAPNGEARQAAAEPFTWSNSNASPNEALDENTITFGSVRIDLKKDAGKIAVGNATVEVKNGSVKVTVGGVTHEISASGEETKGGDVKHDGHGIGKTHKHKDVTPGGALTGEPI